MKPALTIAQDCNGKFAVLFAGDKRQMPAADALFHSDAALRSAGLTGEVEVVVYRAPLPFRRRTVLLGDVPLAAPVDEAGMIAQRPRGRPRKDVVQVAA
jgi:hypothetical protein